ncbi:hypothetical protein [Methylocystis sp.]|uniref:hypothetical protein n=1 Tax=Methylocystis sp. TaxID=1911079 RepID=UPI003DA3E53D
MLASVEACRNRQPSLFPFFGTELSETDSHVLSGDGRFARQLNAFFETGCLNGNWFSSVDRDQERLEGARLAHDRRQRLDGRSRRTTFKESSESGRIHVWGPR